MKQIKSTTQFCEIVAVLALIFPGVLMTPPQAVAAPVVVATAGEPALLEPERAFQLSARRTDRKTVELRFKIADGYYMYRDKFKFSIEPTTSAKLGKATLPKGNMKQDPTFGRTETHRDSVRILLPVTSLGEISNLANASPLQLRVTSQGCADAGVCYPPMHQTLTLQSGNLQVVFPDIAESAGGFNLPSQSRQQSGKSSLTDALKKTK